MKGRQNMKASMIGASGAVGREVLRLLLEDNDVDEVVVFARKPLVQAHAKLQMECVDFNQPQAWADKVRGDVAFSCLGTTLKDAGSKAAQYRVDVDYQYDFARSARHNEVAGFVLVSSALASAQSHFFYTRIKGELEDKVRALAFAHTLIIRPNTLIRPDARAGEIWGVRALQFFNRFGLLQKQRPMSVQEVAARMVAAAKTFGSAEAPAFTILQEF